MLWRSKRVSWTGAVTSGFLVVPSSSLLQRPMSLDASRDQTYASYNGAAVCVLSVRAGSCSRCSSFKIIDLPRHESFIGKHDRCFLRNSAA